LPHRRYEAKCLGVAGEQIGGHARWSAWLIERQHRQHAEHVIEQFKGLAAGSVRDPGHLSGTTYAREPVIEPGVPPASRPVQSPLPASLVRTPRVGHLSRSIS